MATKAQLISDIMLRVTGGKPSDDLELEYNQVAFWIDQVLGTLIKDNLDQKLKNGEDIDPVYFSNEQELYPVLNEKRWMDSQKSAYISICKTPMSLYRDGGIVRIETQDGVQVDKITIGKLDMINNMTFSKPNLERLVYHRVGTRLYINGLTEESIDFAIFNVWYVARPDLLSSMDDTDEVKMGEDIPAMLAEAVAQIAAQQVIGPQDMENDSEQDLAK